MTGNDVPDAPPSAPPLPYGFDLENPILPGEIAEQALTAGGYPYAKALKRKRYEKDLRALQIELLKLQYWIRESGTRLVAIFEGRDTAGKGGTINRITQHLNPRHAKVVALAKPTEAERGQWYFQRYTAHMPTAGDIAILDRSWYNRAGVERVMGFATEAQVRQFLSEAPEFERMLVRDGIRVFKFWLTIGRETQLKRFHARRHDPLKRWKLSAIDLAAMEKWDDYTRAKEDMFRETHTAEAPWTVVRANDKKRTRLNVMRHLLTSIDYTGKDAEAVGTVDTEILGADEEFFFSQP
jgi:polyphosphate kinase 2